MIKTLVFDFDGVILDSFHFHLEKIRDFSWASLSEEEYQSIHYGNFFGHNIEAVKHVKWENYRDYIYSEQIEMPIYDNVKKDIEKLSQDYAIFIITSAWEKNIIDCLNNNNIYDCFQKVLGLETHFSKQEKFEILMSEYWLKKEEILFITDTLGDIKEANNIGIKTIAILWHYSKKEFLEQGNPLVILNDFTELIPFLWEYSK